MAATGAVLFEAARDFVAPVGLGGFFAGERRSSGSAGGMRGVSGANRLRSGRRRRARAGADGFNKAVIFGCFGATERARVRVVEQQSATLRAYAYHWSVLRCGSSSEEREDHSTSTADGNSTWRWRRDRDVANRAPGEDLRRVNKGEIPSVAGNAAFGLGLASRRLIVIETRSLGRAVSLGTAIQIGSAIAGAGGAC